MTNELELYPVYKDSGVPWLGDVPGHWEVPRLKQVCTRSALYGANVPASEYSANGIRFLRTTDIRDDGSLKLGGVHISPESATGYVLDDGDLLISRSGTIGRSFVYDSARHGPCAYAGYLVRFVLGARVVPTYVMYYTKTPAFADFLKLMSIQSTIENVNAEKYANSVLPLPSLPEQTAIVRYLDHVDRKVRHAIRARQQLIKLLMEQKQVIIQRAVTRGLDPNVRLKPSGVPWLGDVPEHWEGLALKRVLRNLIDCEHRTAPAIDHGEYHVVRTAGIRYGKLQMSGTYCTTQSAFEEWTRRGLPEPGDVIFTREAPAGEACVVPPNLNLCLGQRTVLMQLEQERIDAQFLVHVIYCGSPRTAITLASQGSTVEHFNMSDIGALNVFLPPLAEQTAIVQYIDTATADLDKAIYAARREIDLLREYRTRLIADVVMGKLDVRDVTVPADETDVPPEELENIDDVEATDESNDAAEGNSESSAEENA